MPILNYTTKIDCWQTVGEIQQILAKTGASHFSTRNENGVPVACTFSVDYLNSPLNFTLPVNFKGVLKKITATPEISRNASRKSGLKDDMQRQALNVGWRILKDWIESQCAIVEAELATIETVFMQYLVIDATGQTLAEKMLNGGGLKLLGNG